MKIFATPKLINALMLHQRQKKAFKSMLPIRAIKFNNNGKLSTLIKLQKRPQKVSARSLASISTDHSTSDQDSHLRGLLSVLELTMLS
jgi:hypothetical protein